MCIIDPVESERDLTVVYYCGMKSLKGMFQSKIVIVLKYYNSLPAKERLGGRRVRVCDGGVIDIGIIHFG